jgi:hypothetical protein
MYYPEEDDGKERQYTHAKHLEGTHLLGRPRISNVVDEAIDLWCPDQVRVPR